MNLGATGLRVSRRCLGMMSYGAHESREWALDEAAAEPIVRIAAPEIARLEGAYVPHAVAGHG